MIKALLISLLTATLAHAQYDARTADYMRAWQIGAAMRGELWTPADLGDDLALWLDASDAGTLWADTAATTAATNGGAVARWDDKSGNDNNATQTTVDSRPKRSGNRLDFDGTDDWFSVSEFAGQRSNTVAVVAMTRTTATNQRILSESDNNVTGGGLDLRYQATGKLRYWGQTATPVTDTSEVITSDVHSLIIATEGDSRTIYHNGRLNVTTTPNIGNRDAANPRIGNSAFFGTFLNGQISELIITRSESSLETAQLIDGYLAHKWGLTANLPSDHPYKDNPPTK